jgi:hypothetical protein
MKRIYIYEVIPTEEVLEFVDRHKLVILYTPTGAGRIRVPDYLINRFVLRFGDLTNLIDKTWEIDG